MNKGDLVKVVMETANLKKKDAEGAVNVVLTSLKEGIVKEGKVQLIPFGSFVVVDRKARNGRNPKTGEVMSIPASKAIRFRPGKDLKQAVKA